MASKFIQKLQFIAVFIMLTNVLYSQVCINKYLSLNYKGLSYDTITDCMYAKNEILAVGQLKDYNNAAHIAKYSANGTVLWSYTYVIDYFSFYPPTFFQTVYLKKIIPVKDGGYLVTGNFDKVLSPFGLPPPVKKYALIAKLDRFGKVVWSKTLSNEGDLNISAVYETSGGDYIAYLGTDNGKKKLSLDHSYSKLVRIDANGNIKWSSILFTYYYDAGGLGLDFKQAITQTRNKDIILGHVVHKAVLRGEKYYTVQGNLHFLSFDYESGKMNWESSYEYPVPPTDTSYTPNIVSATELPDGRLSFITTLYLSTSNQPALTKKGAAITTSSKGKIENLVAYYPADGTACNITGTVIDAANTQTLLFKNGNTRILTNINSAGQINWNRGYDNAGGNFPMVCFSQGKRGYNIFMGGYHSFDTRLLITDTAGVIDCINQPATMIAEPAAFDFPHDSVNTNTNMNLDTYYDYQLPFKQKEPYPLEKEITCEQTAACCTDFIDSTHLHNTTICEGSNYTLPDGTIVKDSGNYYVVTKSPLGCDSIKYYHITVDKAVSKLSLGKDSCLTQSVTVKLFATEGYNNYYWGNSLTAGNNTYNISSPGTYWVKISNTCGSNTDSINIYDHCDYPVYMPSAFSPNDDGLNDYYGISSLNKNRLINFKIFNRWGQLVFSTSDPNKKWDGRYKNEKLQLGSFIYYVEMEGLSGKRITAKGSFLLLR